MTTVLLASYAITGRREIWPLLVVAGLLVLVIDGLVVAQLTDPDRKRRAADRRALVAGLASDAAPSPAEKVGDQPPPPTEPDAEPDIDLPQQDRRND